MIYKEEIDSKANEFGIRPSDVQRDYVFGWVLVGVYTASELKTHLVLKGGNCLRKAYFENARYSADLDFSIQSKLSDGFIRKELNKVCDFIKDTSGVSFEKELNTVKPVMAIDSQRTVYEARLYFKDFYGVRSPFVIKISLDITEFDKIYLPVQTKGIIHPYSDKKDCKANLRCLKLEEVFASKLKCLLQRRQSNDLYDFLTYILFEPKLNRQEIVSTFLKMTIFSDRPGIAKNLLLGLPFSELKLLWDKFVVCPPPGLMEPEDAIRTFKEEINELFGKYPNIRSKGDFFPAKSRNMILSAAISKTQLKIEYDGWVRYVEPYSLAFKTAKGKTAREYFYVYDLTGGSSKPGVKSLVADKLTSIENTDIIFEPRYELELSKAVEAHRTAYFQKPFGGNMITKKSSRHRR